MFLLQQRYAHCPSDLFRLMRHCLNSELKVIQQVENVSIFLNILFILSSENQILFC